MSPTAALISASFCRRVLEQSYFLHRYHRRRLHSVIEYPLTHPIYTIWASNTSLGKTLVSAGLSMSFLSSSSAPFPRKRFVYVKPIQTGFPDDSDSRFVYRKFSEFFTYKPLPFSVFASNSVLKASSPAANAVLRNGMAGGSLRTEAFGVEVVEKGGNFGGGLENVHWYEERKLRGSESNETELFPASQIVCKTMYAWKEAVSPHLAAEREEAMVGDSEVLHMLKRCLENGLIGASCNTEEMEVMCVIETAGGVASPGPSGSLQCDLYRPFRLPAILVGDGRLGGISGTISAYESLKLRGYDVAAVIFEDHGLVNEVPLLSYFRNRVPVFVLPSIPTDMSDDLMSWFDKSQMIFTSLKEIMLSDFQKRMQRLHDMPKKACDIFWWPFTQHKLVPEEKVTVIDSRCGENFAVHKSCNRISQQFDACASWWTQGPDDNLQIELARDMGYTAARYGHVMFPENVYEPALELAEILLEGVGKGWASRVYFSDNGSTAVEIALKMAFRKFLSDNKVLLDLVNADVNGKRMDLKVLALRGSYHGDTLGAMEAQAPSPYTGFLQQPWYRGRGHFLDPPTVSMSDDIWKVALPQKMQSGKSGHECLSFSSRDEIFKRSRDGSDLASLYASFVLQELLSLSDSNGISHIGALIIEPVIQGAGGMQMIDPLYQRILVRECKYRKIPVIFDEVFTGFWRLGTESAAEMLYCQPDIACFAKLMTGGIIPLAVTLASDAVFEAFTGDSKLKALLHGHSYSAHAMGCAAAVKSVKWFKDSNTNMNLISESRSLQELWDAALVSQISLLPAVHRVVALGTLCAIELLAEGLNAGYASMYASSLLKNLREDGIYMRPLGNVIYMMCGPCTSPDICRTLLGKVYDRIQEFGLQKDESAVFAA
ncbi:bifunctional dethiobiotin synthetase/7,8-diamino-pelargonic acid aminotransferase, mitochondrial [Sesamum indicum]|uniref:Bifunctional dethiobiotin synthetase/7,8-diamino-pelargonic acid aminotransferase, mitochondrial n=1 Tax=Sesamum indicum TaxID=4182 RepID=A0A6I9SKI8_SESIN|nr:bifunctional dethiobiotin synthetase/7,8-diamino-pelargonic acid aminotransferase, mitochondrial [Sesamum indicum]